MFKVIFFIVIGIISFVSSYYAIVLGVNITNAKKQEHDKIHLTNQERLVFAMKVTLFSVVILLILNIFDFIKLQ